MNNEIRVRFAPSPTGHLHIGGVRTALYNYLFARHCGGKFLLRIEDTDRERSTEASAAQILEAMEWLGMDWDEELTYQSQRLDTYRSYAERLVEEGKAYYCDCTKSELALRKSRLEEEGVFTGYDGRCRERGLGAGASGKSVIRLKTDDNVDLSFDDLIRGPIRFDSKEIDDFIIMRSDGYPTYNFAVVVDDNHMRVSHVLRGDDHITNTPKQIALYRALGFDTPAFGHFSMILGDDRSRLSKRHGATSVTEYREKGYLPGALLNYLAKLGWGCKDKEIFTLRELTDCFTLEGVNRSPAVFSPDKLDWVNQEHIKNTPAPAILDYAIPILEKNGIDTASREPQWFWLCMESLKGRIRTLDEIPGKIAFYFNRPGSFQEKDVTKAMKKSSPGLLREYAAELEQAEPFTASALETLTESFCGGHDTGLGSLAQPLRLAITGTTVSPGIFEVLELTGKEETLHRLGVFIEYVENK